MWGSAASLADWPRRKQKISVMCARRYAQLLPLSWRRGGEKILRRGAGGMWPGFHSPRSIDLRALLLWVMVRISHQPLAGQRARELDGSRWRRRAPPPPKMGCHQG